MQVSSGQLLNLDGLWVLEKCTLCQTAGLENGAPSGPNQQVRELGQILAAVTLLTWLSYTAQTVHPDAVSALDVCLSNQNHHH